VNRVGKLAFVAGILAIALAVPIATAHLIFVYEAQATVKPWTPVVFQEGPDATAVSLSVTNSNNPQISLTIPVTNSSETYIYQALEVTVNAGSPYLYVDSCSYSYSGSSSTSYAFTLNIIVYPTTGSPSSPAGTITITASTSSCTPNGYVQLTTGTTYYVDFQVVPWLPIKYGASSGTLTIYFGLTNQSVTPTPSVPVPTP
jgi:hypothetical protein